MTANTETEQLHQLLELVLTELDRKSIPFAYMQEIDRKGKAFIEQAARRAPAVIDTRARYSGSIQELKQYASEDVDAMVHICNKHIGNVPKGFFLAMQECAALVGRDPAAPVPQCPFPCGWQNLHALTVAEGAFLARSLNEDEPITAHQRDVVMRVVHYGIEMARTMLAAAPQPPEADHIPDAGKMVAAPVQLPEPVAAESRFTTFAGNRWRWCTVEHARAFGADKGYEVRYLYTEQQVRQLLAAHDIQEQST